MGDWIDTLLDVGCAFDWVNPALGFVLDVVNGPGVGFVVPESYAARAHQVLKDGGFDAWGVGFVAFSGVYTFTVRANVAGALAYDLAAAGVQVLAGPPRPGHGAKREGDAEVPAVGRVRPIRARRPGGWLDRLGF